METLKLIHKFSKEHDVEIEIVLDGTKNFLGFIINMRNGHMCKSLELTDLDLENCPDIFIILNQMLADLMRETKEFDYSAS